MEKGEYQNIIRFRFFLEYLRSLADLVSPKNARVCIRFDVERYLK